MSALNTESDLRGLRGACIEGIPKKVSYQKIESKTVIAPELKPEYMSESLRDYVYDEAARMGCSPDYVLACLVVALATIAGAKFRMKPKQLDNWLVVPNLWGCIVGSPSTMKSPATNAGLKALEEIEKHEKAKYKKELNTYKSDSDFAVMKSKAAKKKAADLLKNNDDNEEEAKSLMQPDDDLPEEPTERVLICNDTTTEALGIELASNPYGVLIERDELAGFVADMNKSGREGDRAWYLAAWNGNKPWSVKRVSRDNLLISNLCVSVFGGIQPDKLKPLVKESTGGGEGNDGFIQRFQIAVYPEPVSGGYRDRAPKKGAYEAIQRLFKRIHQIEPNDPDEPIVLGFDDDAQQLFIRWFNQNANETQPGKLPAHLESHFSKYNSLIPSLALLFHLVESTSLESVGIEPLTKAVAFSEYLKGHAKKVYSLSESIEEENAIRLAQKFNDKLEGEFTIRDIIRGNWKGIGKSKERALAAVEVLLNHSYVTEMINSPTYGKSTTSYLINTDVVGVHS